MSGWDRALRGAREPGLFWQALAHFVLVALLCVLRSLMAPRRENISRRLTDIYGVQWKIRAGKMLKS